MTLHGFLHSEICGSKLAYSSPQLIAVNHVLLRLPMPRHSPCAHVCFTFRFFRKDLSFLLILLAIIMQIMILPLFLSEHWLLVVFLPDFISLCTLQRSDVVYEFAFANSLRSFLIFALHLLFSFQDTKAFEVLSPNFLLLSKQISEERLFSFSSNLS